MGSMSRSGVYFGITAMVLLSICGPAKGQDSSGSNCITALVPCADYLNTTGKPPSSCCTPVESEYKTQKTCLCNLLNQTNLIQQFHINVTQALEIPVRCGLAVNTSSCSNLGRSGTSSGSPPPPPASSSSTSSKKSAASSHFSFEILPLLSLLLLGVAAQIYQ